MDAAKAIVAQLPPLKDLTIDNITDNVHLINSRCENPRTKYLFERLVTHLHDFARETRLSTEEWMTGIEFLTATGHICTEHRQEFILLSDVLGLSLLVDAISHPKPAASTDGTVLGPFHTHDAPVLNAHGTVISHDDGNEAVPLLVECSVSDVNGQPLKDCVIDVWETDSTGHYDVQRPGPNNSRMIDGRGVLTSDEEGHFSFMGIVPVSYPIPHDGPVGKLLKTLGRHPFRPAHMHFMFKKDGYDNLITSLYVRGDPFESSDAVFGVKESLVTEIKDDLSAEEAARYGVKINPAKGAKKLRWDFVLVTEEETKTLKDQEAIKAMERLGRKVKLVGDSLPVPAVD